MTFWNISNSLDSLFQSPHCTSHWLDSFRPYFWSSWIDWLAQKASTFKLEFKLAFHALQSAQIRERCLISNDDIKLPCNNSTNLVWLYSTNISHDAKFLWKLNRGCKIHLQHLIFLVTLMTLNLVRSNCC